MTRAKLISYVTIVSVIALVKALHLSTPFLVILFSYFALDKLTIKENKSLAVSLFLVLVLLIFYGFVHFLNRAFVEVPAILHTVVPVIVTYAKRYAIELPFTDVGTLRGLLMDRATSDLTSLGNFAKLATDEFISVAISLVVVVSMFSNPRLSLDIDHHLTSPGNLYLQGCHEIANRFRTFYGSFRTVMGAQLLISTINTTLTGIFILAVKLPYAALVIVITFLCGMLPIVGNIISNIVILGIGLTVSPQLAVVCLLYLVGLHKLEYLLNSKIVGSWTQNPVWLTLVALVMGDRIMGIPGMIVAPVVLHYVKVELSGVETVKEERVATNTQPSPVAVSQA